MKMYMASRRSAVLLAAASLAKMPGRRVEYIAGRKARRISPAKRVHQREKKSENETWQPICLCGLGGEMKNTYFARKKWKVNSKKTQNYPLQKCIGFPWQGFGSGGAAGVISGRSNLPLPVMVIGEGSLPVLISTHELLVQLRKGSDRVSLVGLMQRQHKLNLSKP